MIDSITSVTETTETIATANNTSADDLQSDFLLMLTTQLQNQDPLDPMDSAEMTSQMAQINMVSGIEEINATLKIISDQISLSSTTQTNEEDSES